MAAQKTASCHPDRVHHARGYCNACYKKFKATDAGEVSLAKKQGGVSRHEPKTGESLIPLEPLPLNTFDFAVCDHVVRLLLKYAMDKNKVIDDLCPGGSCFEKGRMLEQLENDIRIKTALQRDLSRLSLDDKAKEHYVQELWNWFHNEKNPLLRGTAARILGKAFIADRVETTTIESLPIQGFEDGLKRMLAEPEVIDDVQTRPRNDSGE